ncbi:MAG: LAGLIDADG endonuclease [Patescibacteria group bacterium]
MGSLTEEQQSIILGSLLGDGYMACKTHAYLKIGHSIKQKDYVDWKYNILSPLVKSQPKSYLGNGTRVGYRFWTKSLPALTPYYKMFYGRNGQKQIPDNLVLTPLALSIWYMDDGARNRASSYFNTQSFTIQDQKKLLQILDAQFGLKGNLNKDKTYFRIRLFQKDAQRMKSMIKPLIPDFMYYKLPFRPRIDSELGT